VLIDGWRDVRSPLLTALPFARHPTRQLSRRNPLRVCLDLQENGTASLRTIRDDACSLIHVVAEANRSESVVGEKGVWTPSHPAMRVFLRRSAETLLQNARNPLQNDWKKKFVGPV